MCGYLKRVGPKLSVAQHDMEPVGKTVFEFIFSDISSVLKVELLNVDIWRCTRKLTEKMHLNLLALKKVRPKYVLAYEHCHLALIYLEPES